jgi:hypothetical protein
MHCSDFRELHCAYIDDALAGVELVRMERHMTECPACAKHDTKVRRSLMVARSLTPIEPSADFARKLEARLRECRQNGIHEPSCANFKAVAAIGMVASVLMIGYVAHKLQEHELKQIKSDIVVKPVIAMATPSVQYSATMASNGGVLPTETQVSIPVANERESTPRHRETSGPAILASISAGMPLWPAALFAEQVPTHLASYRRPVH